jgi:hypothetical protein
MRRTRYVIPLLAAALGAVALTAAAPRHATVPGTTYTTRFTATAITPEGGSRPTMPEKFEATDFATVVVWAAGRGRMDIVEGKQSGFFGTGDYILFDSTDYIIVHPATNTFFRVPAELNTPPAPRASPNATATLDSLGAGDVMGGYATQHYRVTTRYAMSPPAIDRQMTAEYWLADIANLPPFPFGMPAGGAGAGLSATSNEMADRIAMLKTDRPMGKVLIKSTVSTRVATLSRGNNGGDVTREIGGIKSVEVDVERLVLPEGMKETVMAGMEKFLPSASLLSKDGGAKWRVRPSGR